MSIAPFFLSFLVLLLLRLLRSAGVRHLLLKINFRQQSPSGSSRGIHSGETLEGPSQPDDEAMPGDISFCLRLAIRLPASVFRWLCERG